MFPWARLIGCAARGGGGFTDFDKGGAAVAAALLGDDGLGAFDGAEGAGLVAGVFGGWREFGFREEAVEAAGEARMEGEGWGVGHCFVALLAAADGVDVEFFDVVALALLVCGAVVAAVEFIDGVSAAVVNSLWGGGLVFNLLRFRSDGYGVCAVGVSILFVRLVVFVMAFYFAS